MSMHAVRLGGAIACLAVILGACGGDDAQDEPKEDSGIFSGNDGGTSSGNPPPADTGAPQNPQCPTGFKTTGFKPGTVVESRARPGGAEWTDLNNAFTKNGTFAR